MDLQCKKTSLDSSIFSADLGKMPLATLGEWMQADDWEAEGTMMLAILVEGGSTERDIGPWEDPDGAGLARQVQGKLRKIKMRVPVPPQPMCPPTTRIDQNCHVLVEDGKVIKETSTISLDVPYGDYFNVIIRDTFTLTDSGVIHMERVFGLEWVKSTMMKSMVETNVPPNLVKDAEKIATVMKKWISSGGPPAETGKVKEASTTGEKAIKTKLASAQDKSACGMSPFCCAHSGSVTDEED